MYLGRTTEVVVSLTESNYEFGYEGDTAAASGVLFSEVTFKYWRQGMVALQSHPLLITDWIELGNGNYVLKIPGSLIAAIGFFHVDITGPGLRPYSKQFSVEPTPLSFLQAPNVCVITGNVSDITGSSLNPDDELVFRVSTVPRSIQGSILNAKRIVSKPDAYGNFSIQLIRGIDVNVEIKLSGINFKITVPDQAVANLLDLMPPF